MVDTSALMAILQKEPQARECEAALENAGTILISAGTLVEALIVGGNRGLANEMLRLIDELAMEVVALDRAGAIRAADSYAKWGKGRHGAGLNLGDCFAHALAIERGCALVFIGRDFARTDIARIE
ncbi:MAG: type II toxin-antitoxin system VapC family toxin [Thalassobaculum sp.]|uniref:type II toxin-antitoxin system VapC family toxin n=1 Tax=Thalassobaculum sp. TaxID=2022740 RepID=UPI0032EE0CFD